MREQPTWFLGELKMAGRENPDQEHAQLYDAKEDRAAERELRLLKRWNW